MGKVVDQSPLEIASRIFERHGQRVMLDVDLAAIYGVTTARLNQQFRRNRARFPADFAFEIPLADLRNLMLQNATSSWGGRRKPPIGFTEHGAIMMATVLSSPRAVQMSVYVVRAFAKMRELLHTHTELAQELRSLRSSLVSLDAKTQKQFDQVYEAILSLMSSAAKRH
ncbi:MAG: ORF6N domain-containing protein [Steroidobacteraceae bacterium]|nr:ORF6N domain-containing protein [Steroidobacteraceae bacterium]MCW5573333.1 ORF6N domain-containing protein [Steroidobacteraceae bacterium]